MFITVATTARHWTPTLTTGIHLGTFNLWAQLHTQTQTYAQARTQTHTGTHTRTYTHKHARTHTNKQTHTVSWERQC